jgi:uncharacterized membrane protein (Fun14 family)
MTLGVSKVMSGESISHFAATVGGGFFTGVLVGWALKKVFKILAILVGLFLTGLAFLQYQQIASINWNKIEGAITTLASATISSVINDNNDSNAVAVAAAMSNFGIPLTSSMSIGFTIGFLKG